MPPPTRPPSPPQGKSTEQQLREAVNAAAVDIVGAAFDAIDQLTELGKDKVKKAIIAGMSGPRRKKTP